MGKTFTAKMDLSALLKKFDALPAHLRKSRDEELRLMAGRVIKRTIGVTPPFHAMDRGPDKDPSLTTGKEARAHGEMVIGGKDGKGGDIRRAYKKPSDVYAAIVSNASKGAANEFWSHIKMKNWGEAQKIINRVLPGHLLMPFDDGAAHRAARKRGRVPKGFIPRGTDILRDVKDLDSYIMRKIKNVGLYASSLLGAALDLKISVPAWIKRHRGKLGGSAVFQGTGERAYITITASAPFLSNDVQRRMNWARDVVYKNLKGNIKSIIRGALKKAALNQ
jgi:hypothetical protein